MKQFRDYLLEAKTAADIYKGRIDERINICLGNVSCDMDSSIGVFVLGFHLTHKHDYFSDPGNFDNLWVPVVNCPRGELRARNDIAYHIQQYDIDLEQLVYIDDIDLAHYATQKLLSVAIIDHNKLDMHQSFMRDCVTLVVDHHVDLKEYELDGKVEKRILFCGSACSIAINMYYEHAQEHLLDPEICNFFAPAILLDTENLKPSLKDKKWGEIDEAACLRIFRVSMDHKYKALISFKTNRQMNLDLGLDLILKKDYKNYQWGKTTAGISVCFNVIHDLITTFSLEALRSQILQRMHEKKLDLYFIITQTYVNGNPVRELMLFDEDTERFKFARAEFEKHCPFTFKVKKFTGLSHNFAFYILQDDSVSRKKIEPIFKDMFEQTNSK